MAVRGELWNGKKNDLAKKLRLTKNFVSVGVDDLERSGLLIRISAITGRRGRPPISYQVSGEVRNDLKRLDSPFSSFFDELFLEFVSSGIRGSPRKAALSVCNRLLLAVLLDHASDTGLVTDVSNSDLQRMTGLNAVRVRNRLSILMDQGLIRFYAPGFASARFPGGKVKSSYVLSYQILEFSTKRPKFEVYSPKGSHVSNSEYMFEGEGRGSHIKFRVSKEIMPSVWLLLHRIVAMVLSSRREDALVESNDGVYELIASTLQAGFSSKVESDDFRELCADLGWWAVSLANRYIDDYSIESVDEGDQIAVLPYDKHHLILIRVPVPSMD